MRAGVALLLLLSGCIRVPVTVSSRELLDRAALLRSDGELKVTVDDGCGRSSQRHVRMEQRVRLDGRDTTIAEALDDPALRRTRVVLYERRVMREEKQIELSGGILFVGALMVVAAAIGPGDLDTGYAAGLGVVGGMALVGGVALVMDARDCTYVSAAP